MVKQRVTLADVARRAGVSRTTASFVTTGRQDMRISADAVERVTRAAKELNYRPNLVARSLRTNATHTLGLVSDTIASGSFAGEMVRGAMNTAHKHSHLLFIGETDGEAEIERELVQSMLDRGVGGFVYASMSTREATLPPLLSDQSVVLANVVSRGITASIVLPDERMAGRAAATELLSAGHREGIVIVGGTRRLLGTGVVAARERLHGIDEALASAGTMIDDFLMSAWTPDAAYEAVLDHIQSAPMPKAMICMNDRVALGAYQAIAEVGRRIPDDVSVISFDDSDLASWLRPGLTSVALPHYSLGQLAIELLLTPEEAPRTHYVPMPVTGRQSVGRPRR